MVIRLLNILRSRQTNEWCKSLTTLCRSEVRSEINERCTNPEACTYKRMIILYAQTFLSMNWADSSHCQTVAWWSRHLKDLRVGYGLQWMGGILFSWEQISTFTEHKERPPVRSYLFSLLCKLFELNSGTLLLVNYWAVLLRHTQDCIIY